MSSSKQEQKKIRVGVLFGGQSGEHEVSLASAKGIMAAMDTAKYDIVPIGITKSGRWLTDPDIHQTLVEASAGQPELPAAGAASGGSPALSLAEAGGLDVIFPVLHGPYGEDGTVQGFLELLGLPYVGAGVTASAVGMDKALCKEIFKAQNLPIVAHVTFLRQQWLAASDAVLADCEASLRYPMFVKPANLGSSVGIHKAKTRAELRAGLDDAIQYDRKVVVEQGVEAREIEVSVLGNEEPQASVPGEIIPSREFYSYAAKYLDGDSELLIPAPLEAEQTRQIQMLAVAAFRAIDCAGLARCDFLLEKETGQVYVNELNTMPGFTPISMYPKLWAASGVSYSALIDRLIELALARHQEKQQLKTTFDVSSAQ